MTDRPKTMLDLLADTGDPGAIAVRTMRDKQRAEEQAKRDAEAAKVAEAEAAKLKEREVAQAKAFEPVEAVISKSCADMQRQLDAFVAGFAAGKRG